MTNRQEAASHRRQIHHGQRRVRRRTRTPAAALAILLAAFATSDIGAQALDVSRYRVVDLTHPLNAKTLYWPTATTGFQLQQLAFGDTPGGYFYSSYAFAAPEHGGTHLDAPIHFHKGGLTADRIPVEQLIAPAVVIDVSAKAAKDADYRLTVGDVQAWEKTHGRIPRGAFVMLRTGWGIRWPNARAYLGDDTPGDASKLHFPSYGVEAATFLVQERKVGALGADVASIDYGPSKDFKVHQIASAASVIGLENVARREALPAKGATV
ncbi:MAG TPA: cyclase family protein, partial [Gemmatimonadaceae bacterium]|nr:cyclase family protein [Gemmatimonadaceae bacterium]